MPPFARQLLQAAAAIAAALCVAAETAGCGATGTAGGPAGSADSTAVRTAVQAFGPGAFSVEGIMGKSGLEGGCWVFTGTDGTRYQLIGGDTTRLLHDGLTARIIVRNAPRGNATICMTGNPVEVLSILSLTNP